MISLVALVGGFILLCIVLALLSSVGTSSTLDDVAQQLESQSRSERRSANSKRNNFDKTETATSIRHPSSFGTAKR
jgi:hypothetical protein